MKRRYTLVDAKIAKLGPESNPSYYLQFDVDADGEGFIDSVKITEEIYTKVAKSIEEGMEE